MRTTAPHQEGDQRALRMDFDPVSRVPGGLSFHTTVDLERGEVLEAGAMATLFRGYEVILQGRDPRDAIFVSSRACGVCGGAHAMASAQACEMAFGIQPPPMGIVVRNLLAAIEILGDLPTQLFVRTGPDFSEPVVRATNPEIWERAQATPAPRFAMHGYERIADIMSRMTLFTGELYEESLRMARTALEGYVLMGGKYPHPQTVVPGGMSTHPTRTEMNVTMLRVVPLIDYAKKVVAIWDDLVDFFLEADPRFAQVGEGPMNFLELGIWDDPYAYDGSLATAGAWGERRWATPGAIVDGQLRTTDLQQINASIEELVAHSFYDEWSANGNRFPTDPVGNRLSPNHPWNKQTLPRPAGVRWPETYSWSTAPRWDGRPMETGASARLWTTALARKLPHTRFAESTGASLRLRVPQGARPEAELEWRPPERWGALERNRARAYALAHSTLVAYETVLIAYDLLRKGGPDSKLSTPYRIPKDSRAGAGFWGGGRGSVSHHMQIGGRVIENYQIIGASTWSASPVDASGTPGPLEQAVAATPLLSTAQHESCIDVQRAIRSFDPCMPCTTH